jgi:protein tyrosine phosphatase (PTP) superfamily phosphohydrolase (DUF442 family)
MNKTQAVTRKCPFRQGLAAKALVPSLLTIALSLPVLAKTPLSSGLESPPVLPVTAATPAAAETVAAPALSAGASVTTATPDAASLEKTPAAARLEGKSVQAAMVPNVSSELVSGAISNFEVVSQNLWRGAQPSHKAIEKLAQSGVKTIVDLRYAGGGCEDEAAVAEQYGIKYINIPFGFENPSLKNVAKFLAIVSTPANQPVFVHCRQGADRTGTVVGIFRILHDHWSFSQAYDEMRLHHFKPWLSQLKSLVARCEVDPTLTKELSDLVSKLEQPPAVTKVSTKAQPTSI